jgi:hemerythrin-like metal-binding protein
MARDRLIWDPDYSVGNATLDAQHQALLRTINELADAREAGGEIAHVFDALNRYIRDHFRDEEVLMAAAGYADLEPHQQEHRMFEDWLRAVEMAYNSYGASTYYLAESVDAFLRDWLLNHILIKDMAYKSTLVGAAQRR